MANFTQEIITANLFNSRARSKDFIEKRAMLIEEAINFPQGTIEKPKKSIVAKITNGKEVYFLKPGKETSRKTPNVHDMFPNVSNDFDKWAFGQIWEYLIKISIVQQAAFKQVLVLLYRLCFYTDHKLINNKLRYKPSTQILEYINNLEKFVLKVGFQEKFKTSEAGLLEFLYFIDLLAWNEDVKYHCSTENKAYFTGKYGKDVGRKNTILTLISAPILISKFISNIIESTKTRNIIDVKLITTTIQKFTKTRGLCILSNSDLIEFLQPYLEA
jgi:hypothetical protein